MLFLFCGGTMKKIVEIKKLGINGEGIGYVNRKVCFIKGALVGEKVEADIQQVNNKNFYIGQLLKIIKPSSHRVKSCCYQHEVCQGCQLLHLAYPKQLEHKKALIQESIQKYTDIDLSYVKVHDVIGMNQREHYQMCADLPIVEFQNRVTFGIYQRESKYLTVMTGCMKHHPLINETLLKLEKIFTDHKCKTYNDKFKKGLRFIKIRVIANQVHLVIITGQDGLKEEVISEIKQIDLVKSLFMSINTSRYQDFEDQGYKKLFGNTKNNYVYDGKKYLISVKSDIPANQEAFMVINKVIRNMVKDSKKIISLYSQLGIMEVLLDQEVVAFDEKKDHVEDGSYNARALGNDHVKFVYGPVDKKVIPFAKKKIYDTYIIRNEKNGISKSIKETLRLAKAQTIIYVGINPSTIAKDLQDLSKYYQVSEIKPIDSHLYQSYVTTVIKLVRK